MAEPVRLERDSMGELNVPIDALYGAQTQRAIDNFNISGLRLPPSFVRALGLIKSTVAEEMTELPRSELELLLKPLGLTGHA